jgi:hypothetical protein
MATEDDLPTEKPKKLGRWQEERREKRKREETRNKTQSLLHASA